MRARNQTDVSRKKLTWWMVQLFLSEMHRLTSNWSVFRFAAVLKYCCVRSQQEIWVRLTVFVQSPTSTLVWAEMRIISNWMWAFWLCCLVTMSLHCCMRSSWKREFSPRTVTLCEAVHGTAATGVTLFFLLPARDSLVPARWCVFKGCPVPLKHCIMAALFCLLSLADDTSAFQRTI